MTSVYVIINSIHVDFVMCVPRIPSIKMKQFMVSALRLSRW